MRFLIEYHKYTIPKEPTADPSIIQDELDKIYNDINDIRGKRLRRNVSSKKDDEPSSGNDDENEKVAERDKTSYTFKFVGYFYSPKLKDTVFILPKVIEPYFNGPTTPESVFKGEGFKTKEQQFLREFSLCIYQSLKLYNKQDKDNSIIYETEASRLSQSKTAGSHTLIDVVLGILRFNKEHSDYLKLMTYLSHSGCNNVDWEKTITHNLPFIQNGIPIYFDLLTKRKKINFDDELLVIYYSILNYLNRQNFARFEIPFGYELIRGKRFLSYIDNEGKHLKEIKYKYFSDIDLELWNLCYSFFRFEHFIRESKEIPEMTICTNFNTVYEKIIDQILGGDDPKVQRLKDLPDGKILDHLFLYDDVIKPDNVIKYEREHARKDTIRSAGNIFYIADSKYYGVGNEITGTSLNKQFSYSKGIIQKAIDDEGGSEKWPTVRDIITEGYNIIPNFFIRAKIDKKLSFDDIEIDEYDDKSISEISCQFGNRLFDRDTILLYTVEVNLLNILKVYGINKEQGINRTRDEIYHKVKDLTCKKMTEKFCFFAVTPKSNVDPALFFRQYLYEYIGKVYAPYQNLEGEFGKYNNIYSMALQKGYGKDENLDLNIIYDNERLIRKLIDNGFVVKACDLGEDPLSDQFKKDSEVINRVVSDKKLLDSIFTNRGEIADSLPSTHSHGDKVLLCFEKAPSASSLTINNKVDEYRKALIDKLAYMISLDVSGDQVNGGSVYSLSKSINDKDYELSLTSISVNDEKTSPKNYYFIKAHGIEIDNCQIDSMSPITCYLLSIEDLEVIGLVNKGELKP